MSTSNFIWPNHSSSNAGNIEFVDTNDANTLIINAFKETYVQVDTSNGNFKLSDVDFSNMVNGQKVIFKKITSDSNRIIDGVTNHVNKKEETIHLINRNGTLIII